MGMFRYVLKEKTLVYILTMIIRIIHQDDIEEAFVVKQILQHLAANMVLIFMRWHLKEKKCNVSDDT